jgi:hypothetical protein
MSLMKAKAIRAIDPSSKFSISGEKITWVTSAIPEDQINIKQAELQAEYDAQEYARKRKPEYPPIGDQLDDLFHGSLFSEEMTAKLQAVKDKYPKG